MEDYYNILDIESHSNEETIRKAYRKLARKYHPDHNRDIDTTEYMQKINNAYGVLSDPKKRLKYDYMWYKNIAPFYYFKDISTKKKSHHRKYRDPLLAKINAENSRELQDILDRACAILPNDKSLHRLARLHREDPETCSYKFKDEYYI